MKKKKLLSVPFLIITIILMLSQSIYANEIDKNEAPIASVTEHEDGTIVKEYEDGTIVTLKPTTFKESRLNVTKTMEIDSNWRELANDRPALGTTLRVINISGPGDVAVRVTTSYYTDNTYYCWYLSPGYEVSFQIGMPYSYKVDVSAADAKYKGTYKLQATDW